MIRPIQITQKKGETVYLMTSDVALHVKAHGHQYMPAGTGFLVITGEDQIYEEGDSVLVYTAEQDQVSWSAEDEFNQYIETVSTLGEFYTSPVDSTGFPELSADERATAAVALNVIASGHHTFVVVLRNNARFQRALSDLKIPYAIA